MCTAGACGLFAGGAEPDASPGADSGPDSTATDTGVPPDGGALDAPGMDDVVLPLDGGACDAGATSLLVTTAAGCPQGTTVENLATNPVAGANACACGACTPTTQPNCAGNATFSWGPNNNCSQSSASYSVGAACTSFGITFNAVAYNAWTTINPTVGACTATAVGNPQNVTTTPLKQCVIPAQSPEIACAAQQAGGYRLCVPYGAGCSGMYSVAVDVGTGPDVSCAACTCSLTAGTCQIEYFGDSNCTQSKFTELLDGQCRATNSPQGNAYYKAYPVNLQCKPTAGAATPKLANASRLCCTP